jgi:DNA-binding MarR family transcriptional regulator
MTFLHESRASHDLEIAKATELTPESVSKTIGELLEAGLIEPMPLTKATFYTLTPLGRDVVRKYL